MELHPSLVSLSSPEEPVQEHNQGSEELHPCLVITSCKIFVMKPKKSPCKLLRDVKRITKYNERKRSKFCSRMSIHFQSLVDIPPENKTLTTSVQVLVDIKPVTATPKLSFARLKGISIPPIKPLSPPRVLNPPPSLQYSSSFANSGLRPTVPVDRRIPQAPNSPPAARWIPPWAQHASSRHVSPFSNHGQNLPYRRP